jgi:hypothetical protein
MIAPFDLSIRIDAKYRFLCSNGVQTRPQFNAFPDWITGGNGTLRKPGAGAKIRRSLHNPRPLTLGMQSNMDAS